MASNHSEESVQRKERLEFLMRERDGKPRRDRLSQLLDDVPDDSWRIIPLNHSDVLEAQLSSVIGAARENQRLVAIPALSRERFGAEMRRLLERRSGEETIFVSLTKSDEIGLIEARTNVIKARAVRIIDFDRDSLITSALDFTWGVVAQRFEVGNDKVEYLIESWGL